MSRQKQVTALLLAAAVVLALSAALTVLGGGEGKTAYYEAQVSAAQRLEECFSAVRGYKAELGLPMSGEDHHRTGLIGLDWSGITTTLGAIEAKRTTAWPDMGALCVRLLYEAGVRPGDTVGAGFSGSFPAMDMALVAACESMDVKLVYVASVGASTYGANDPALTLPEMLWRLAEDGVLNTYPAAVTMGGEHDAGEDMDPALAEEIKARLRAAGMTLWEEPDFSRNLAAREELYRREGPIQCFVAVGGNVTSLGRGESGISLGQGVLNPSRAPRIDGSSGLVQRYLAQGLPVVNLLNIKRLAADYGLPFDPAAWPPIGESAVYATVEYPKIWVLAGLAGTAALLLACARARRGKERISGYGG